MRFHFQIHGHAMLFRDKKRTLTDLIVSMPTDELQTEVDAFRASWEAQHGHRVDLTRRYTCQLPKAERDWLFQEHPDRYVEGLPPFFRDFLDHKLQQFAKRGQLDEAPEAYMKLFIKGTLSSSRNR